MHSRLADRLHAARRRQFVGRADELALFQSTITAPELPFNVLHVFGPGGVGKTTLLAELSRISHQAHIFTIALDARHIEPSPDAFIDRLRTAMGLDAVDSPIQALAERAQRVVIFVDTFELLAPLDAWLRDVFLPQLPGDTLVVLAGRQSPSPAWRIDPGWQDLVRTISLRNFSPKESLAYLARRAVPPEQHQVVLDFTYGHPLALSLVADTFAQRPDLQFQPESAPDVVKSLLEQLIQQVPGPAHRAALEACALLRLTTEPLLAEMLAMPDAHELFEWLRGLSFVESGRQGLFPHDLAREALSADLRWRNPDWYAELHRRARTYFAKRVPQTHGPEQQRLLFDYIYLHRDNPVVRPFFDAMQSGPRPEDGGIGSVVPDAMLAADVPSLVAMVAQHEGDESARIADYWFGRQPDATLVFRDAARQPIGFVMMLALDRLSTEERAADPSTRAAWHYLDSHAPLRPGERGTIFRFWMAQETHQLVSPIQSLIFVNMVRHYLTTPGLAFTVLPCADPDFWAPMFAYADLMRLPAADFEVGGRSYGVYGHDWRSVPPMAWLALLAEREVAGAQAASPPVTESLLVLSQPAFSEAVRDAMRNFTRPDLLRKSSLLRSRLVVGRAGGTATEPERVAAMQAVIREAAEVLQCSPRETKLYQTLDRTYFRPAPTQEQAAELLDLPFSTFRRHLTNGVTRLTEILWHWELNGPGT